MSTNPTRDMLAKLSRLQLEARLLRAWLAERDAATARAELAATKKKLADARRRMRLARCRFVFTEDQWDELRDYTRYYLDERRVMGEWYAVARAVRAMLEADEVLDLRRPLRKRKS